MNSDFEYILLNNGAAKIKRYLGDSVNVVIPDRIGDHSVVTIMAHAFENKKNMVSVVLPLHLRFIGCRAFAGCEALAEIVFPDDLKRIGKCAFQGCAFTSVSLPEGIWEIRDYAFRGCLSLSSYSLPQKAMYRLSRVFSGCPELAGLVQGEDDFRYTIDKNGEAVVTGYVGGEGDVVIPERMGGAPVTAIASSAFDPFDWTAAKAIRSVVIPRTVRSITEDAFRNSRLTSVTLACDEVHIGESAFQNSRSLRRLFIKGAVLSIAKFAFAGCPLEEVVLPGPHQDRTASFRTSCGFPHPAAQPEGAGHAAVYVCG